MAKLVDLMFKLLPDLIFPHTQHNELLRYVCFKLTQLAAVHWNVR